MSRKLRAPSRIRITNNTTTRYNQSNENVERIDDISMSGMEVGRHIQFGGHSSCTDDPFSVQEYTETDINNSERLEEDAVLSFFEKFHEVYGDDHINFQFCSLRQAIGYSCLAPEDERKGLLLYLHKDNDEFSHMICEQFADCDSRISNILETSFDVLPWDLDTETNGALETAVDKWPELTVIKEWIKRKRSSLFILVSDKYSVNVFAKFDSNNNNADHIVSTLKEIEGVVFEPQNDCTPIGAKEYHKIMYDRLGDRDYDFFEAHQHDALKQKIGFSKFGPPSTEDGYDAKQIKAIENTYQAIMIQSNKYSESLDCVTISFVFNCLKPLPSEVKKRKKRYRDYNEYTDIMPIPVYIIRKCSGSSDPCRIIIDHDDRVYESWSDYIEDNKLHKCMMVAPKNGRYKKVNDEVSISEHYSPACAVGQDVLKGADITSAVIGVGTTGVYVAAAIPALAVAPIALTVAAVISASVGIYSIVRSSITIHDRRIHAESMSFANSEARGAYLNIVAGSLGFVGAGATAVVSQLAGRGLIIGTNAKIALNAVNGINAGTSAANVANSTYEIIDKWIHDKTASALSVLQWSCSLLFFHNAVINFKTANVIINEAQNNALTSFKESLSDPQRKTLNKLLKETIFQNQGNGQKGNAEVIQSLSNVLIREETIAFLTCNSKRFNKYGVKFTAKNGKIALNGVTFDMSNLETVTNLTSFISDLPPTPTPTVKNTKTLSLDISYVLTSAISFENLSKVMPIASIFTKGGTAADTFVSVLSEFQPVIRNKIIQVFVAFIKEVNLHWLEICKVVWQGSCKNPYVVTLQLIIEFVYVQVRRYELDFRKRYGDSKKYDIVKKTAYWLSRIMNIFVNGPNVSRHLLQMLVDWMVKKSIDVLEHVLKLRTRVQNARKKNTCTICSGTFTTI
ncbi:hypothetical protein RI129_002057 [Pyrocoelia pectoralis]|uniref:DUF4781 domain-containing protein n=1 Tax=Pyrocoelia pectoralis TaxID=417401 RepID=A0AAN7ZHM7_9COLE